MFYLMSKHLWTLGRLVLLCSGLLWFPSSWKRWTHGFRPAKCTVKFPDLEEWKTADPDPWILEILKGKFSYWKKGAQSYVFLSQDQQYVLKLFRFDTSRMPYGQQLIRSLREYGILREKHFLPWQEKVVKTFTSCYLASTVAPDLTGVIWAHLNVKESRLPPIFVTDRLGRGHRIDPSRYRFVLQKRAEPFLKTLLHASDRTCLIESYFSLLEELSKRGLANLDPNMGKNFGFLDGKAVEIDFGNFALDPDLAAGDPARFALRLRQWLDRHGTSR